MPICKPVLYSNRKTGISITSTCYDSNHRTLQIALFAMFSGNGCKQAVVFWGTDRLSDRTGAAAPSQFLEKNTALESLFHVSQPIPVMLLGSQVNHK